MSNKHTPRFPGLVRISVYALIPTLVLLCIIGYEGCRWVLTEYLSHRAIKSAFANTYADTVIQVERARSIPSLYDLIGFKDQSDIHTQSEALIALKLFAKLGTTVAQQNHQAVTLQIDEITNARPVLESISRANSFYIWTAIKEKIPSWRNVVKKLSNMNAQKHYPEKISELKKRYAQLKDDVSAIILVPFDRADDQVSFYTEGVLMDLPIISGIPDALNSLEELRDSLQRVNGRVVIPKEVENPKIYFTQKLDGFKEISKEIRTDELFPAINVTPVNTEEFERQSIQLTNELLQEVSLLISKLADASLT